jgi:hypothetical protein
LLASTVEMISRRSPVAAHLILEAAERSGK